MTGPLSSRKSRRELRTSSLKRSTCSRRPGRLFIQYTTEHLGVLSAVYVLELLIIPFLEALNDNVLKIYVSSFFPSGLPLVPFPSLEWPLPSKSGPYELLLHQQPRSHHRAQYETEGSRGAVKTSNGGHPEVQVLLFIILERNAQKWEKNLCHHTLLGTLTTKLSLSLYKATPMWLESWNLF